MYNKIKKFGKSIVFSILFSGIFGTILFSAGIPITVVLPTTAPIWMGISTMLFMTLS